MSTSYHVILAKSDFCCILAIFPAPPIYLPSGTIQCMKLHSRPFLFHKPSPLLGVTHTLPCWADSEVTSPGSLPGSHHVMSPWVYLTAMDTQLWLPETKNCLLLFSEWKCWAPFLAFTSCQLIVTEQMHVSPLNVIRMSSHASPRNFFSSSLNHRHTSSCPTNAPRWTQVATRCLRLANDPRGNLNSWVYPSSWEDGRKAQRVRLSTENWIKDVSTPQKLSSLGILKVDQLTCRLKQEGGAHGSVFVGWNPHAGWTCVFMISLSDQEVGGGTESADRSGHWNLTWLATHWCTPHSSAAVCAGLVFAHRLKPERYPQRKRTLFLGRRRRLLISLPFLSLKVLEARSP